MNRKMTTNSQLSTTESKNQKLSKQLEQEQNHRNGITLRFIIGRRRERTGGERYRE